MPVQAKTARANAHQECLCPARCCRCSYAVGLHAPWLCSGGGHRMFMYDGRSVRLVARMRLAGAGGGAWRRVTETSIISCTLPLIQVCIQSYPISWTSTHEYVFIIMTWHEYFRMFPELFVWADSSNLVWVRPLNSSCEIFLPSLLPALNIKTFDLKHTLVQVYHSPSHA